MKKTNRDFLRDRQDKYSIRKLAVGTMSVLIGCIFLGTTGYSVQADTTTNPPASQDNTEEVQSKDTDQGSEAPELSEHISSEVSESEGQAEVQEPAAKPAAESLDADDTGKLPGVKKEVKEQPNGPQNDVGNKDEGNPASAPGDTPSGEPSESEPEGPGPEQGGPQSGKEDPEINVKANPEVAIKGEVPELDPTSVIDKTSLPESSSILNSPDLSVKWLKAPDVSKIGKAEGTAEITYDSYDENGNPVKKTIQVKVPVDVRNGQVKQADQLRNTLNFIDKDTQNIILSHTWLGKNGEMLDKDGSLVSALPSSVELLGYTLPSTIRSDLESLAYFGNEDGEGTGHDKILNIIVQKWVGHNPQTGEKEDMPLPTIVDDDKDNPFMSYAYGGRLDKNNIDPAEFINGLGELPEGATVSWKVAPVFDEKRDADGNFMPKLTNTPVISIKDKDGKEIYVFENNASNKLNQKIVSAYYSYIDGPLSVRKLELTQDDETPAASSAFLGIHLEAMNEGEVSRDVLLPDSPKLAEALKDYKFEWVVAPDMHKTGYQYCYYKLVNTKAPQTNMLLALLEEDGEGSDKDPEMTEIKETLEGMGTPYARVLVYIAPKKSTPVPPTGPKTNPPKHIDPPTQPTSPTELPKQPTQPQPPKPEVVVPEMNDTVVPKEVSVPKSGKTLETNKPKGTSIVPAVHATKEPKGTRAPEGNNEKPIGVKANIGKSSASAKVAPAKQAATKTLPKTGESRTSEALALGGLSLIALATLLGFAVRKRND